MSDTESENPINPFAVPVSSAAIAPERGNPDPLPPPQLSLVFIKWFVICAFAAGPSFYFGGMMGNWRLSAVVGMVIGILIFVIAYTAIEFTTAVQEQMRKPVSRRASWIAYFTRVVISIVYPVGLVVDMICGFVAVGLSSSATGITDSAFGNGQLSGISDDTRCFYFIFTTIGSGRDVEPCVVWLHGDRVVDL